MASRSLLLIILVFKSLIRSQCLRDSERPLVIDYSGFYYISIVDKFQESTSVNNCSIVAKDWSIGNNFNDPDLKVTIVAPSRHVRCDIPT